MAIALVVAVALFLSSAGFSRAESVELLALAKLRARLRGDPTGITPAEAQAAVDDTIALLGKLDWFDPPDDVPERIRGARIALAIAGALLHRHGYPDKASAVAAAVRILYTTWGTASALEKAAVLKAQVDKLNAMPPGPRPFPSRSMVRDFQRGRSRGGAGGGGDPAAGGGGGGP